jgi:cell division protein FtsB
MPQEEFGYDGPETDRPNFLARLVRLNRYLLALLIIPAAVLYFRPPLKEQEAARTRLVELTARRDGLKADAERLQRKLELIKTDPDYLESMARDRLNLQKDGEIILRFED